MDMLIASAVFLCGIFLCMAMGWSLAIGLAFGLVCFTLAARRRGHGWRALASMAGDGARTTDRALNMCAVGRVMADTLNAAGINTLHDETLNDYPSYTGSYANSRAVVQQYLAQYPSIKVVLDVHRDAIENDAGARMAPVVEVNGRKAAQVMLICGCDNGSTVSLPNWRQNLRFAAAWESAMEGMYPGFTRPVLFSYRFYNQDLTTGSLLIEIGTHGNNLNEALYAGQLAANALVSLFGGAG